MTLIEISLIDEIENLPIRIYTLDCGNDIRTEDIIHRMNGQRWKYDANIDDVLSNIRALRSCQMVKQKTVMPGGWSGGPIGMRKYVFPSIYEHPPERDFDPDTSIKCMQEGVHLTCSIDI